jgi:hypothetical protein
MVGLCAEHPRPELAVGATCPVGFEAVPQPGGGGAEREKAVAAGLGCPDHVGGDRSGDVQHPAIEVAELQPGELPPPCAAVSGEPEKEEVLFGAVPPCSLDRVAAVVGDCLQQLRFGGLQQGRDRVVGKRAARLGAGGASHHADRVMVDDPLVVGPADRSAQCPDPSGDHARRCAGVCPAGERPAQIVRSERHRPHPRHHRVSGKRGGVRAVPDERGRLPRVVRCQPPAEKLGNGQHRRRPSHRPPSLVLSGQLGPVDVGVRRRAVKGDRTLQRPTRHRIGPRR